MESLIRRIYPLVFVCILTSCGGNTEKQTTDTTSTDTSTLVEETPTASGIVTSTEHMMLVRHRVSDFTKFKTYYDQNDSLRTANGLRKYVVGRSLEDTNIIFVAVKANDIERARAFSKSPALRQAMQKSGAVGSPSISVVTVTWQDTSVINSTIRSLTTFPVKSWSAWRTAFDEGRQERMDNGIITRVIGHDAADSNKIILVTAITDTAKAAAYWTSDALKKRRAASGVTGNVDRFVFNVVQRY